MSWFPGSCLYTQGKLELINTDDPKLKTAKLPRELLGAPDDDGSKMQEEPSLDSKDLELEELEEEDESFEELGEENEDKKDLDDISELKLEGDEELLDT